MYFDSHAHYDDSRYDEDRETVLEGLKEKGVGALVNIGACMQSSKACIDLANKYRFIYAAVGVHPHDIDGMKESDIDILESYTKDKKVVAIGEIGLDYHYEGYDKEKQIYWFKKQIELAKKVKLPIIIHSRDASKETFDVLESSNANSTGGVIHCFSGSAELAKEYVKRGYHIGIGGSSTFKNSKKVIDVIKNIDIKHILLETDCPYLSPEPFRGKRNDSSRLVYVAKKIAELKDMSLEEVADITYRNCEEFYKININ